MPWLHVDATGSVTLQGVTIMGSTNDTATPSIVVGNIGTVIVGPQSNLKGTVRVNAGGAIRVDRATVASGIDCTNGSVDVLESTFASIDQVSQRVTKVGGTGCNISIRRSRFSHVGPMLAASGGLVVVENNLFATTHEYADSIWIRGVRNGSVFRYNTVVNTVQTDTGDGVALDCDGSVEVSNSVFTYRSQHPFTYAAGCLAKFSVFDDVALPLPTAPIESSFHPFSSLFLNPIAGDFRLSSASPAKQAADPTSTVTEDLDGTVRPRPAGSRADAGAFEAD